MLTATLPGGLTYIGDDSGVTPTIGENTITWYLPDAGFLSNGQMTMRVRIPNGAIGMRYLVNVNLTSAGPESNPTDNGATVEVMIARQVFLPMTTQ